MPLASASVREGGGRAGAAAAPGSPLCRGREPAGVGFEGGSAMSSWKLPRWRPGPRGRPRRPPSPRLRPRGRLAPTPGPPAPPPRPSRLDGARDHVAAVGVLVQVGRQVVAGTPQLRVRVLVVEPAVAGAVADHLLGACECGHGQRQHEERAEDQQMSKNSNHSPRSPPESYIVPGPEVADVCDPCHKAKFGVPPRDAILPPVPVPTGSRSSRRQRNAAAFPRI